MDHAALRQLQFQRQQTAGNRLQIERDTWLRATAAPAGPSHPEATATGFADWLFQLDHPTRPHRRRPPSESAIQKAKALAHARRTVSNIFDRNAEGQAGDMTAIYCDDGSDAIQPLQASALTVGGRPLALKPDLVLQHASGMKVIVECKVAASGISLPEHGWSNLAAQLWAYSLADPWVDQEDVYLAGLVYQWNGREPVWTGVVPRTQRTDEMLNAACRRLFEKWGGRIDPARISNRRIRQLLAR